MLDVPETQQVADRFAPEVEDLKTIARLHGVPMGSPDCLVALPLRISQDFRLRSDLTEHVRSLQAHDPELGLAEVLSLFALAFGGPAARKRDRKLEEPMDLLGGFFASLGNWPGSAVEPLLHLDNPPDHDPRLDAAFSATSAEALRRKTFVEEVEVAPAPIEPEESPAPSVHELASLAEITHALARLERGNLELRLHLDSIDQRICRMEPLLESVPHVEPPEAPVQEQTPPVLTSLLRDRPPAPLPAANPSSVAARHSLPLEPELTHDALERDRNLRRLALTSAFTDALPLAPLPGPESPRPAAPHASAPLSGAVHDPVPAPRTAQLRRDRFAAARELPGNDPDQDPLYNAPYAAPMARTPRPFPPEPDIAVTQPASPVPVSQETAPVPLPSPLQPSPAPEPEAPSPQISNFQAANGIAASLPVAARSAPSLRPTTPSSAAQTVPRTEPREPLLRPSVRSPLFGAAAVAEEDDQPRKRRPWFAGIALLAVLGSAGLLYLNGLPAAATRWLGGDFGVQRSPTAQPTASSRDSGRQSTETASAQPSPATASSSTQFSAPRASNQRRLPRQDSTTSDSADEITPAPTFVPGPVMDGHLVAAPRPEYPGIAHLAGVDGQVTLDVMISKAGEVEALKVLGGPHLLRDSAAAAVRHWQYRPFLVKGKAVEVRTIVHVDVGSGAQSSASE